MQFWKRDISGKNLPVMPKATYRPSTRCQASDSPPFYVRLRCFSPGLTFREPLRVLMCVSGVAGDFERNHGQGRQLAPDGSGA